jgi:hypothetical protein
VHSGIVPRESRAPCRQDAAGNCRYRAVNSKTCGQLSIHETLIVGQQSPALLPFVVSPPHQATPIKVWILRNGSSVIILHLLSMNRFCAALHNIVDFQESGLPQSFRKVATRWHRSLQASSKDAVIRAPSRICVALW